MKKLSISEPLMKHAKVLGYLVASGLLAYVVSRIADKPEYVYAAPAINYLLYVVEVEIKNQGVVKTMLNK